MSRIESAIRAVLAFKDAMNKHDVDAMLALTSGDCVFESASPAPDGTTCSGKEAIAAFWQAFFEALPDAHIAIEDIFSAGYRCIMHWNLSWTDGAGLKQHIRGVDIFEVQNDLIRQHSSYVKGQAGYQQAQRR